MDSFPDLLKEISPPLKNFSIRGAMLDKNFSGVAIVGTRNPSSKSLLFARDLGRELALIGIPIISGLALGIDAAAHEGCLSANGKAVAVLACGTDIIYPSSNRNLAEKIIEKGGSIISEYEKGERPMKHRFLERNRIVAGLSFATIVIEAPEKSGSIRTAGCAAEFGRDVLVLSGSFDNPNFRGSHLLIRDGARLVSSIGDIIEDLGLKKAERKENSLPLDKDSELVIKALLSSSNPLFIDKISELTDLEPRETMRILSELSLLGLAEDTPEGYLLLRH